MIQISGYVKDLAGQFTAKLTMTFKFQHLSKSDNDKAVHFIIDVEATDSFCLLCHLP